MTDFLATLILLAVVGVAAYYVYRAKKKGIKCIGCPAGSSCCGCGQGDCPSKEQG